MLLTVYNITITDTTTRRKGFWILYAKYEKKDKMESNVEIIVPCKSKKLNKTGNYLLVTDSTIDGETLRLGDSDLLLQYHLELEDLVYRKKRTCRQVSVVLSEIRKAVNRFIWDYLRPNWPKFSYLEKWSLRMFRMPGWELLYIVIN